MVGGDVWDHCSHSLRCQKEGRLLGADFLGRNQVVLRSSKINLILLQYSGNT